MDRVTEYAKLVVSGKRIAGKAEIACCQRHLNDMKKGKSFPYVFDVEESERHISIANTMTIGEGDNKKPLQTRGFQNFIIGSIFGWREKGRTGANRKRRFREAYIQMGRQNGKSMLMGEIANDFATFSGYRLGRIFCTATKQDQANIVWDEVHKFIKSDADLLDLYKVKEYEHEMVSVVTETSIKAIGKDTKTADGFRSILAIVDEYHAHPTNQMYKLMLDGQITVDNALTVSITTAGFNLNYPCYKQYQFCKKILSQTITKDSLFIYIAEMDSDVEHPENDDDIWNPTNWLKANPYNLWKSDTEPNEEMMARMAEKAIDAKEKGAEELVNFMTKSLNCWVTSGGGSFIDAESWRACSTNLTIADMAGRDCILGFDLSSGGDLTTIALVFPLDGEMAFLHSRSFMPKLRLQEHEKKDEAPYRIWVKQGLLILTDGEGTYGIKTDYKFIIKYISEIIEKYKIKFVGCGYDGHNASAFLTDLADVVNCDMTEVVQSAKSLSDTTKDFQLAVKAQTVLHEEKDELLTWSMLNAILTQNSFGEIKIDKMTDKQRIDAGDATLDAWKIYFLNRNIKIQSADETVDDWLELINATEGGRK